jgi:predicted O-methyltransferase YrrM
MDRGIPREAENFVKNLTGAGSSEIQDYIAEIRTNREFHNAIGTRQDTSGGRRFFSWGIGISQTLGMVLYAICRKLKPDIVVETGVSSGVSSSYFLCALEASGQGELYSIDLPWSVGAGERQSGWLIPDYLRHRWHLNLGKSSDKLAPLLEKLEEIDIFLHDSDHSYRNMRWEFETAWARLRAGGLLLSHNIDSNSAFADFGRSISITGFSLNEMGGIVKTKFQ